MRNMASSRGNIAAIVGVGPNLGLSIARKFAHEGYTVAILARDLGMNVFSSIICSSITYFLDKHVIIVDSTFSYI